MTTWTVVGLVDADDRLYVAGMVEGDYDCNQDCTELDCFKRWCAQVEADDPYEAEANALDVHDYGGVPVYLVASQVTVGAVVVDDVGEHTEVTGTARGDDGDVLLWFADDGHDWDDPARYDPSATLRVVPAHP